jgi:DNA primase
MISPLTYKNLLKQDDRVYKYITSKLGYTEETIDTYNVGLSIGIDTDPFSNRLLYPIRNEDGDLVTYQGRALFDWKGMDLPKYWHGKFETGEKATSLFGFYEQKEQIVKANKVVITEGPPDSIAFIQSGIPSVAALGTAFSIKTYYMLRKYTDRLIFAYDNDPAGEKAFERVQELLKDKPVNFYKLSINDYKDAHDVYTDKGKEGIISLPVTKYNNYENS